MSDGPVANYVYNPWKDRPGKEIGFNAVGPGWQPLLEAVDSIMKWAIETAVTNTTIQNPRFRNETNTVDAHIGVEQIKEKFGGLRIYWESSGIEDRLKNQVYGAIMLAESLSFKICEKCGSFKGTETRVKKEAKWGHTLTLCGICHEKRGNSEIFEIGNGDKV